jgi:oxygen-independent coproporphyrinogen-3 oxidase
LTSIKATCPARGDSAAMASLSPLFDPSLLRRHDLPGPRYTSYPTAPHFAAGFDALSLQEAIGASNDSGRPLSLYLHVPFCSSPCFYCGCNRVITRDRERGQAYLQRLQREVAMLAPLFDRQREVCQLHLGGGTPNFLSPAQLGELLHCLRANFDFAPADRLDCSIELDPRFVDPGQVTELAALGFNRASLGVQDFDPAVQQAVNRVQPVEPTLELIRACHRHGFASVNVDLIYGLPLQTQTGFARTLDLTLQARPDRMAIYAYAHLPQMFRPQRQIREQDLPSPQARLDLLQLAIDKLGQAGYEYIGMDHFALPDDPLALARRNGSLHRNFMGYTTCADSDLLGMGVSAISHIGNSYSRNPRDLPSWEQAIDGGRLPVWRGVQMDQDDLVRADLIQELMCHGRVDYARIEQRYGLVFRDYFCDALAQLLPLQADGLVQLHPRHLQVSERGRLLLRRIAMCFDRYLPAARAA